MPRKFLNSIEVAGQIAFAGSTNLYGYDASTLRTDGYLQVSSLYSDIHVVVDRTDASGKLLFGSTFDTNLYRGAANTLKTDDLFLAQGVVSTDGTVAIRLALTATETYIQSGALGAGGSPLPIYFTDTYATTEFGMISGAKLKVTSGTITLGSAEDTNLYRSAANTLKTDDLFDASPAGLRTKHESAATPTGGNSGEVRVGTDKVWFQDAGTWKSVAPGGGGTTSFATLAKFGTD